MVMTMMNERLQKFARQEILKDLEQLSAAEQHIFRLMYSPTAPDPAYQIPLVELVNLMSVERLSWAMEQTRNTVNKLHKG